MKKRLNRTYLLLKSNNFFKGFKLFFQILKMSVKAFFENLVICRKIKSILRQITKYAEEILILNQPNKASLGRHFHHLT